MALACTGVIDDAARMRVAELLAGQVDWTFLFVTAVTNRVIVDCLEALSESHELPSSILAALNIYRDSINEDVERVRAAFEAALPTITAHNQVILLRGICNAYTLHRDRPMRRIGDVDLLIDLPITLSLSGIFEDHHHVPGDCQAACNGDIRLEYHYDLNLFRLFGRNTAKMPMGEFWSRATILDIGGITVRSLSIEDNFLYLSFHNLGKGLRRLYRFVDMISLLQSGQIDWATVCSRAGDYGLRSVVWANCRILNLLKPGIVPDQVMAELRPAGAIRFVVTAVSDLDTILHARATVTDCLVLGCATMLSARNMVVCAVQNLIILPVLTLRPVLPGKRLRSQIMSRLAPLGSIPRRA